jgi:hypothetical protein
MSELRRRHIIEVAAVGASILAIAGCGGSDSNESHQTFTVDCPPEKPLVAVGTNRLWRLHPPHFRLSVSCLRDFSHEGLPIDVRAESDAPQSGGELKTGETEYTFRVSSSDPDMKLESIVRFSPEHLGSTVINMETSDDPTVTAPTLISVGQ